jgi:hypothetical protein
VPSRSTGHVGRRARGALVAVLLLWPSVSRAAIDLTGAWRITLQLVPLTVPMVMTQSGTTLSATIGIGIGGSAATGVVDPDTGAFTLAGSYVVRPGIPEAPPEVTCHYGIAATASADGQTFTGTHDDDCGLHSAVSGVRDTCGNGVVDPGETCDAALPCCTATCQLAPVGTACPDDTNRCTDDACDASGMCQHTPNTAPCSTSGCTSDTCAGGACVPGDPLPAGMICPDDGNPCTADTCDATGGCQHPTLPAGTSCADDTTSCTLHTCSAAGQCLAAPRECPSCETCVGGQCIVTPAILCSATSVKSLLDLRVPAQGKQRLQWTFQGTPTGLPFPADFGDPRSSARYALCVYLVSATSSHTMGAAMPPGGSCSGRPCWSTRRGGFGYDDRRDAAGTGIRGMRLVKLPSGVHRILISGAGPNLDLPATFGFSSALVQLVVTGGAFPGCWQADLTTPLVSTSGHFRARQ